MEIIGPPELESALLSDIGKATSVHIAVAYFTRVPRLEKSLAKVPDVRILVSDEWDKTNVDALLAAAGPPANIRCIPQHDPGGRLHAKVILGHRRDHTRFGFVGSANVSSSALQRNRELVFRLSDPNDGPFLDLLFEKLKAWSKASQTVDFDRAREMWRNREQRGSLSARMPRSPGLADDVNYWILKTSAGAEGRSYWPEFKGERVVAIGWEDIALNPLEASEEDMKRAIASAYPDDVKRTLSKVMAFCRRFWPGDRILVIRGFTALQSTEVFVYGLATVWGDFIFDADSHWWKYKMGAFIEPVERGVPAREMRHLLGMGTCLQTIHAIDWARFRGVVDYLAGPLGLPLDEASIETIDFNDSGGLWQRSNPWLARRNGPFEMDLLPAGRRVKVRPMDGSQGQWMTSPKPGSIARALGHEGVLSLKNRCRVRAKMPS